MEERKKMNDVYIRVNEREEVTQFLALMRMMNSANQSIKNCRLLEVDYIHHFKNVTNFNYEFYNSRDIILGVMSRYQIHKSIRAISLDFEKRFIYEYEGATITVSYNMSLYFDVLFMCCLFGIASCNIVTKPIKLMIDVMTKKYDLRYDYDQFVKKSRQVLTLMRVARSFPSVTINACKVIQPTYGDKVLSHFLDLPIVLLNPLIFDVLIKAQNMPIELLAYLAIMSRDYWPQKHKHNLRAYRNIIDTYRFHSFPKSFKIKLLKRWGIVSRDHESFLYNYNENLINYCIAASGLIKQLKRDDRDVNSI